MAGFRRVNHSLGPFDVPGDKLWGVRPQRALQQVSIGHDLIPHELVAAYAVVKRAAAAANHTGGRLDDQACELIRKVGDEIRGGEHHDMFALHVWMTGSGIQFNINEVITNRGWPPPLARHAVEHDWTLKEAVQLGLSTRRRLNASNGKGARRAKAKRLGGRTSGRNNAGTAPSVVRMTSQPVVIERDRGHGEQNR